jgi:cyclic pyranopterin phosphate synthase
MLLDKYNRPIRDLRISVTDRCNYRCSYCMPCDEYVWIDRNEILTFEEIERLARVFMRLGTEKVRLTGGEPLLRKNLDRLVSKLAALEGLKQICVTTNAELLAEQAEGLAAAGLRRINVSLDTLDPERFRRITKRGNLDRVLAGLATAKQAGLSPIKINAVIERGVNDDDIIPLVEFAREQGFAVRFIEYMDVGNSNNWISEKMVSGAEVLAAINAKYPLRPGKREDASAPSVDYEFADGGGDVGVIASVTQPFCGDCTRARLTADGKLVTCLFSSTGLDLKSPIRRGASDDELLETIANVWRARSDRYSEERLEALNSPEGYKPKEHRKIEMITLGG